MAIHWAKSFSVTSRKKTVEEALYRIESMVAKSYLSALAAKRGVKDCIDTFITHFGDLDLTNADHVKRIDHVISVLEKVYDRITRSDQVVNMVYVANDADYSHAATVLHFGALPAGVSIDKVEAFVLPEHPDPTAAVTVFICPSFFTGDTYIPNAVKQRTGTGTIVHELSHMVGGTNDHAYTWDADKYSALTPAQRADNADSYRAYCQSFDNPLGIEGV